MGKYRKGVDLTSEELVNNLKNPEDIQELNKICENVTGFINR